MRLGVMSDTHNISEVVIKNVMDELRNVHKVEMIVHCGDINPEHISAELFGNLPLACALVEGQEKNPVFEEKNLIIGCLLTLVRESLNFQTGQKSILVTSSI